MATRLNQIFEAYMELLEAKKSEYKGIYADSVLEGLAFNALPENLIEDEYTRLNKIDADLMYFELKDMTKETLLSRSKEMGYEVIEPEKGEKFTGIKKGDLVFTFDLSEEKPYLLTSVDHDEESVVASFLKKLYSK